MAIQSGTQEKGETQLRKTLVNTLSTSRGRPNLLKGPRGQTCELERAQCFPVIGMLFVSQCPGQLIILPIRLESTITNFLMECLQPLCEFLGCSIPIT
jgi:hypothetical protein